MKNFTEIVMSLCAAAALITLTAIPGQAATITPFENNQAAWQLAAGTTSAIDFEAFSGTLVTGDEFIGNPGSPAFSLQSGSSMFSGDGVTDFIPTSGINMLYPINSAGQIIGEIRVTFSSAVSALSAFFMDVEVAFAVTGFDLGGDGTIDVAFSGNQGDDSQSFLGFTTDMAVTVIDIHFGDTGQIPDGVAIDDLSYALAPTAMPEPGTLALFGLGLASLGFARRKKAA